MVLRARLSLMLIVLLVLPFSLLCAQTLSQAQSNSGNVWNIYDVIEPSLDSVKWSEQGGIATAPWWVSNGDWNYVSVQESLVSPGDIFVSWYESFNWILVNNFLVSNFNISPFSSISDFSSNLTSFPFWWLNSLWKIDPDWSGISANTSKVMVVYNDTTSTIGLSMWFHITRIPEYFIAQGGLQNWLAGFDLTPVSTGALTAWEFHEDWNQNGQLYNLYFEAPAHVLSQNEDNYTFSIGVSSLDRGQVFNTSQIIEVDMPANTEIKQTSPASMAVQKDNTASFVKAPEDAFPSLFTVVSGSPSKSLGQVILGDVSLWFLTPGGWAAIASLLVISLTGLRERRIWHRNRLYHRLYRSMVSIYDMYQKDLIKFNQEMDSLSSIVIKMLVEDKINDEQFEKLLKCRDDLLMRTQK